MLIDHGSREQGMDRARKVLDSELKKLRTGRSLHRGMRRLSTAQDVLQKQRHAFVLSYPYPRRHEWPTYAGCVSRSVACAARDGAGNCVRSCARVRVLVRSVRARAGARVRE